MTGATDETFMLDTIQPEEPHDLRDVLREQKSDTAREHRLGIENAFLGILQRQHLADPAEDRLAFETVRDEVLSALVNRIVEQHDARTLREAIRSTRDLLINLMRADVAEGVLSLPQILERRREMDRIWRSFNARLAHALRRRVLQQELAEQIAHGAGQLARQFRERFGSESVWAEAERHDALQSDGHEKASTELAPPADMVVPVSDVPEPPEAAVTSVPGRTVRQNWFERARSRLQEGVYSLRESIGLGRWRTIFLVERGGQLIAVEEMEDNDQPVASLQVRRTAEKVSAFIEETPHLATPNEGLLFDRVVIPNGGKVLEFKIGDHIFLGRPQKGNEGCARACLAATRGVFSLSDEAIRSLPHQVIGERAIVAFIRHESAVGQLFRFLPGVKPTMKQMNDAKEAIESSLALGQAALLATSVDKSQTVNTMADHMMVVIGESDSFFLAWDPSSGQLPDPATGEQKDGFVAVIPKILFDEGSEHIHMVITAQLSERPQTESVPRRTRRQAPRGMLVAGD